jgi:hypothetical protein
MRPSLLSAFRLVIGLSCAAASIAVLVGVAAEWGVITGTLQMGGAWFFLVVLVEAVALLLLTGLLIRSSRLRSGS